MKSRHVSVAVRIEWDSPSAMFALEGILACGKTDRKKSKFFQIIISKSTRKLFKAVVIITNPAQNTNAGLDNKSNF